MDKIKQIEKLLAGWKAAGQEAKEKLMGTEQLFRRGGIDFGEAALRILKEPSNTRMQIDTKGHCNSCDGYKNHFGYQFCPRCGYPLSD